MKAIIEMAREAGGADIAMNKWTSWVGTQSTEFLERFAELVRADERDRAMRENAYVLAEREACADAVRFADNGTEAAEIIRARGNT